MTRSRFTSESLVWLAVLAVVAGAEAWLTRPLLNPDGAAYLDLADALRRGEWPTLVQGYWSPLYPVLAAPVRALAERMGFDALAAVHLLNALLVVAGGGLVHRLLVALYDAARARSAFPAAFLLRGGWAAYAVCAMVYARIDGITPDILLVVTLVGAGRELLRSAGVRPVVLGGWLGVAFLAKTSSWPWLLVAWGWLALPGGMGLARVQVARGMATTLVVMLVWLIPLGIATGAPTLGSTGRLNACWFLRDCDGRSPDTHRGEHASYATLEHTGGVRVTYARFADNGATYAPWTDPTAWAAGTRTQRETPLRLNSLLSVVLENAWDALRFLTLYLYLGVLAPVLVWWAVVRPRLAWTSSAYGPLTAALLGVVGIAQFVAVQVQPRLMAPFAWLHVTGLLAWLLVASQQQRAPSDSRRAAASPKLFELLSWIPVMVVAGVLLTSLRGERQNGEVTSAYREELRTTSARANRARAPQRVVVVGEAFPLIAHAKALDIRIVAQILPNEVPVLESLEPSERQKLLQRAGGGGAEVAWQLHDDGRVRMTGLR